jgi:hypothetical protein
MWKFCGSQDAGSRLRHALTQRGRMGGRTRDSPLAHSGRSQPSWTPARLWFRRAFGMPVQPRRVIAAAVPRGRYRRQDANRPRMDSRIRFFYLSCSSSQRSGRHPKSASESLKCQIVIASIAMQEEAFDRLRISLDNEIQNSLQLYRVLWGYNHRRALCLYAANVACSLGAAIARPV